jgi:hypothetical protein
MRPNTDQEADMTATANITSTFEELDYREADGIEVSLLWSRTDNTVSVLVTDAKTNDCFELHVRNEDALDAFRHPFAYAASGDERTESTQPALANEAS